MKINESVSARIRAFGLVVVIIFAAYLSASVNSFENGLIHLALLAGLSLIGLATNIWGGVAASAVAAFAIIMLNQFLGVYSNQYALMNTASELFFFIAAGPLAGSLAKSIHEMQAQIGSTAALAENRATHDETLGAIKPAWAKIRLNEEILRARNFSRPLSIALLRYETSAGTTPADRLAALRAIIRLMSAATQPPVVISYLGDNQILCILPEHTEEKAQQVLALMQERAKTELFFPEKNTGIGKPIRSGGEIITAIAALDKNITSGDALLQKAKTDVGNV